MQNVTAKVKGNILTLEIDLSQTHGPSASGKTTIIGTTQGNQVLAKTPDGKNVTVGVNAYFKN